MSLFGWFGRRRSPEPPIEPSPGARLRLAQAIRGHEQVDRHLARLALDEVDRSAERFCQDPDCRREEIGDAVAKAVIRYRKASGQKPGDALNEMVDFMSKGPK